MREIAKITRFTPDQRQRHSTTFIRRIQGGWESGLVTLLFFFIVPLSIIVLWSSTNVLLHLTLSPFPETPGAIRELDKLNLRFGQELVKVEDARVMPQTEIKQGGMPLRYR